MNIKNATPAMDGSNIDVLMNSNLSVEDARNLLAYLSDMSMLVENYVKIHINEFLGKARYVNNIRVSKYDGLYKYIPKNKIEEVENVNVSLQPMYAKIRYLLDEDPDVKKFKKDYPDKFSDLLRLVNTRAFDREGLKTIERIAASIMVSAEIADVISREIIPYKARAFDFSKYLEFNYFSQLSYKDTITFPKDYFTSMADINAAIAYLMYKIDDANSANDHQMDYANLIYLYLKMLGFTLTDVTANDGILLNRFIFSTTYAREAKEGEILTFASDLKEEVNTLMENDPSLDEVMDSIYIKKELGLLFKTQKMDSDFAEEGKRLGRYLFVVRPGDDMIQAVTDDSDLFLSSLSALLTDDAGLIRAIASDDGFGKNMYPDAIKLYLLPDDLGHLMENKEIQLCVFYDSVEKEMYYMIEYQGVAYVLFKTITDPQSIYGVSIFKEENGKYKIFHMKKSSASKFVYKDRLLKNL